MLQIDNISFETAVCRKCLILQPVANLAKMSLVLTVKPAYHPSLFGNIT
jgi:hypothetical protein